MFHYVPAYSKVAELPVGRGVSMPYVLARYVLARGGDLRISQKFYNEVKDAAEGLPKIVAVEEKFDVLMENFVELESTILTLGARHLAFEDADVSSLINARNLISRRIANFLSATRLYRDALPRHVRDILGGQDPAGRAFIVQVKDQKSKPMGYRMVEVFRNYVQHRDLPISHMTFHRSRDLVRGKTVAFPSWLEPAIDAVAVSQGRRETPPDVVAELAKLGNKANPMQLLREYIEHVGLMHQTFRKLIKANEDAWENSLAMARERYRKRYPKASIVALAACVLAPNGRVSNPHYTSEERATYRRYLRIKNLSATNFSMRYVKWSK